jgi:cell division protein FtsZ
MAAMGKAMMGTGEAEGENRAIRAAEAAINNPLLEDTSMSGARGLLINITGGDDLTLYEVDQAANRVREEVDEEAEIIFGSAIDETLHGRIRVSVVATGIDTVADQSQPRLKVVNADYNPLPQRESTFVPMQPAQVTPLRPPVAEPTPPESAPVALTPEQVTHAPVRRLEPTLDPMTEQAAVQHYAEPVAPMPPPRAARSVSTGLFAPPPMAAASQPAEPAVAPASPETHRSLFGKVTGVFGFRHAAESPLTPQPPAPEAVAPTAPEPVRATVRQTTAEDIGIGIPKFLLRQTSGASGGPRR